MEYHSREILTNTSNSFRSSDLHRAPLTGRRLYKALQKMSTMNDTKSFFEKHVIPSFDDWKKSPVDERLAMNLANNLNNLIEYYWHSISSKDPYKVFFKKNQKSFRTELTNRNFNIGLVRDVADAHKHLKLGRTDRKLTDASQTSSQQVGLGQALGICLGGGSTLVITLDNGKEEYFSVVVEAAFEYWKKEVQ